LQAEFRALIPDAARHQTLRQEWRKVRDTVLEAAKQQKSRDKEHISALLASCTDDLDEGLQHTYYP